MRYPQILSLALAPSRRSYAETDAILYALALGYGERPDELRFVYERGLAVLPTFNVLLGAGTGEVIRGGGLDFRRIVHGEQRLAIHRPLPPAGEVVGQSRVLRVIDKGADKGALVEIETVVDEPGGGGGPYSTQISTLFCRGDGGFGDDADPSREPPPDDRPLPARPADREVRVGTRPDQAALYRLTGDRNPLHIDPDAARAAGFTGPILHGLCTYGIAARTIARAFGEGAPTRIAALDARFTGPLYPGEAILFRLWQDGAEIAFDASAVERGAPVLGNGRCLLHDHG